MSSEVRGHRFGRHFPYLVLELQFPDVRHRAFIEMWHAFPSASVRWLCLVSRLPRGSAFRLAKTLTDGQFLTHRHERGRIAFGCWVDGIVPDLPFPFRYSVFR